MPHHHSQRRNQLPWIGGTVLAVALLVAAALVWSHREQPVGDQLQMARILARLQALEAQREQAPTGYPAGVATNVSADTFGARDGASGAPAPPLPDLTPEQAEQQHRARLQALEAQFSSDPSDPAAVLVESQLLETMVGGAMNSTGLVPRNPDVECRRRSCRITGSFAASGSAEDWVLTYLATSADKLARARAEYVRNADGSIQARIYAARGGNATNR